MPLTIDYFFAPTSPWAYLGHARLTGMAAEAGATVRVLPVDLGKVFPVSGGLPLGKRAPQRQAYRLAELERHSQWLQLPMNIQPLHFPVPGDAAARLIIAVQQADGVDAAMQISGALMAAVWAQERDISQAATLSALLAECKLPASRLEEAQASEVQTAFESNTQMAIDAGVFGSPSYVIDGEVFWGQDRLDFVQRRLARA